MITVTFEECLQAMMNAFRKVMGEAIRKSDTQLELAQNLEFSTSKISRLKQLSTVKMVLSHEEDINKITGTRLRDCPVELPVELYVCQTGWICPKCQCVVSPYEKTCPNCKGD